MQIDLSKERDKRYYLTDQPVASLSSECIAYKTCQLIRQGSYPMNITSVEEENLVYELLGKIINYGRLNPCMFRA